MFFSNLTKQLTVGAFDRTLWVLLAGTVLLFACASSDRIVKIYEDAAFAGGPFNRILVVAAHEDVGNRRQFENSLVRVLNENGPVAVASLSVMQADEPINRDALIVAVRETGADAVMITRLLDVESSTSVEGGRVTATAQRRNDIAMVDFFRYDYVEYRDPMTVMTVHTVILLTDLYNVADETKIWSVESTSFDKTSVYGVFDGASRGITDQLRRDRLIP